MSSSCHGHHHHDDGLTCRRCQTDRCRTGARQAPDRQAVPERGAGLYPYPVFRECGGHGYRLPERWTRLLRALAAGSPWTRRLQVPPLLGPRLGLGLGLGLGLAPGPARPEGNARGWRAPPRARARRGGGASAPRPASSPEPRAPSPPPRSPCFWHGFFSAGYPPALPPPSWKLPRVLPVTLPVTPPPGFHEGKRSNAPQNEGREEARRGGKKKKKKKKKKKQRRVAARRR